MNESMTRPPRKTRPTLEGLEERKLLAQSQALTNLLNNTDPNVQKFVEQHARMYGEAA